MGRSSWFCRKSISLFGQTWLATTGLLVSVTVLFAKFAKGQYGKSILEQLHSDENMKIMHINLRFFIVWTSSLAVNTVMGNLDLLRVSNSPELKSFILNMCIEAPESNTKSGFVGAGITQASAGE